MSKLATLPLINQLRMLIDSRPELRSNEQVVRAFDSLKSTIEADNQLTNFFYPMGVKAAIRELSPEQMQIFMLFVIFRTSSTYCAIADLVALLQLCGQHRWAAIVNDNLHDETGGRNQASHAELLYESFRAVGTRLAVAYPTPLVVELVKSLCLNGECKTTHQLPLTSKADLQCAESFFKLAGPRVADYHIGVCNSLLRIRTDDLSNPLVTWSLLPARCLELAVREASSVDDFDQQDLSFIGLYGIVVQGFFADWDNEMGRSAMAWSRSHNDELEARSKGWEKSAEHGHATDAIDLALAVLERSSPHVIEQAFVQVQGLTHLRLCHWQRMCHLLSQIDERGRPAHDLLEVA